MMESGKKYPDYLDLLREYGTPAHVIRHCAAVSRVAGVIADALNQHGYSLDAELIRFAAGMHDVARVEKRHGVVGAAYLRRLGYPEAADLVEPHMIYGTEDPETITEEDVLCLADRMVKEDCYIGLEKRMAEVISRYKDDPEVFSSIQLRLQKTILQRDYIQSILGVSLDTMLQIKE